MTVSWEMQRTLDLLWSVQPLADGPNANDEIRARIAIEDMEAARADRMTTADNPNAFEHPTPTPAVKS